MMNETKRKNIVGTEPKKSDSHQSEHLQKILNLMAFQSRMPSNPFMDKNAAYEAAGCGPQASMYIFSH